jgi:hypothetical protein
MEKMYQQQKLTASPQGRSFHRIGHIVALSPSGLSLLRRVFLIGSKTGEKGLWLRI